MKYVYTGPTFGVIAYNSKASNALNNNQERRPLRIQYTALWASS